MRNPIALLLTATLMGGVPLAAQTTNPASSEAPQGQFEGNVEVSEVLLDALVTDRDGNVILGLGAEDFIVEEGGEARAISGVSFYSNRRLAESTPAALVGKLDPNVAPDSRFFVVMIEDQRRKDADTAASLLQEQLRAAQRAQDWVKAELLPNDWVAVVSFDTKLKVQTDFTRDRDTLLAALSAASQGKEGRGVWPSRATESRRGDEPSLIAGLPTGKELSKATPRLEQALEVLARAAANVRGRKNLILFSTGFGEVNNLGLYRADQRYYPRAMQGLNSANVAVYSVDLTPAGVANPFRDSLNQLSAETGGRYFFSFTNFITPLREITDENNGYYLLAYSAAHPTGKGGFQRVAVRTKNPEFIVRAREGYRFGTANQAP